MVYSQKVGWTLHPISVLSQAVTKDYYTLQYKTKHIDVNHRKTYPTSQMH